MSDGVEVTLDVFEGPLDLLLHLVKKHELSILDIPISFVTDRYLEFLARMRTLNLDIAGEYLLMAATLAFLKSRELLPSPEPLPIDSEGDEDEVGDPRAELIRRLLEYQKYKEAGGELGDRPVVGRNVWTRRATIDASIRDAVSAAEQGTAGLAPVEVHKLIVAFEAVLKRAKLRISHDVTVERMSLAEKIHALLARIDATGEVAFEECFGLGPRARPEDVAVESSAESQAKQSGDEPEERVIDRFDVVITFLAILEMARLSLLKIRQDDDRGTIFLQRREFSAEGEHNPMSRLAEDYR